MVVQKKILHVVNISFVLPYFLGDQIDHFRNKGYEIFIACSPSSHFREFCSKREVLGFPVEIVRSINVYQDIKSIFSLAYFIKRHKVNKVIGHTPKGGMIAMMAAYLTGVKDRIYFRHGLVYETSTGLKRKILIFIERLTSRLATKVIVVSNSVLDASIKACLNHPSKYILLGKGTCNGINVSRFSLKYIDKSKLNPKILEKIRGKSVIGYVGRMVNDKGIPELIEAWKSLLKVRNDIILLLIGPIEERDGLAIEILDYIKNEETIVTTGLIEEQELYYSIMNIFILPSRREGFPTVILEASAMELPVITSRSTGCIDAILENITGIFTDITAKNIQQKIEFYLDNGKLANQHGKNGRAFIKTNFREELIWDEIERKVLA